MPHFTCFTRYLPDGVSNCLCPGKRLFTITAFISTHATNTAIKRRVLFCKLLFFKKKYVKRGSTFITCFISSHDSRCRNIFCLINGQPSWETSVDLYAVNKSPCIGKDARRKRTTWCAFESTISVLYLRKCISYMLPFLARF